VLATLGLPWPTPDRLTLSFAPDGTRIGLFESDLYSFLGANRDAQQWQMQVLRAFQTWAAEADLDIGLVRDGGQAFSAASLIQSDPRFGDIRVAAFPQRHALANAVPYLPVAGGWSGDVFLNSAAEAGLRDPRVDLFTVLLNEAGNVLGLADGSDPDSAMHTDYIGPRAGLGPTDIDAIRSLYGSRDADSWEGQAGNDSIETAAELGSVSTSAQISSIRIDAELTKIGDLDHYRFNAQDAVGAVTVRVRTAGHSLLVPRVSVINAAGELVAAGEAQSPLDGDVELLIQRPRGGGSFTVRVEGATSDVFAVGRYDLEIVSRFAGPGSPPPGLSPGPDLGSPALTYLDNEVGENDSPGAATLLTTAWGYEPGTRYEAVGTIRTTADVDMYRVVSPTDDTSALLVNLETLGSHTVGVRLDVRTATGELVVSRTISNAEIVASGFEIGDLPPGETYFVSVTGDGRGRDVGNYVLTLDFVNSDPTVERFSSGTLSAAESSESRFFVIPRTQLFRFDLSANATTDEAGGSVELSIFDEQDRRVGGLTVASGQTQRLYVWLTTGSYHFQFTRLENPADSVAYELRGAALSDDTGPGWIDPTEAPLPGDADRNGTVDRGDVRILASQFTQFSDALHAVADLDADGDVDLADLAEVMRNLGRSLIPTSTSLPPPSWASAAIASTPDLVRSGTLRLRAIEARHPRSNEESNVQQVPGVLKTSVSRSRRPQTGHDLSIPEVRSTSRLSTGTARLLAVDTAISALSADPGVPACV
jgi:hypothetical protein